MQPRGINPNLISYQTSYKNILLKKGVCAMVWGLVFQTLIPFTYIVAANANIFHPEKWISSMLDIFTLLDTWICIIIIWILTFTQCLLCAKNYVLMTKYCSTRFQQFCRIFSLHNFFLMLMHVVTGGIFVCQIFTVIDSTKQSLTARSQPNRDWLVDDAFFLIFGGLWTGFYYFAVVYISTKQLEFPLIQQRKYLLFRSNLFPLFKQSLVMAMWSTFYFALFYYFWGHQLENQFNSFINVNKKLTTILIYVYLWWFSTLYCFSNNLMRFFFELYLTEPVQFSVVKKNANSFTLQEAINMSNLPIIQNLACLDLFLLSQWSPIRRQLLFTLSEPGGHPYNFNFLTDSVLELFTNYTNLLKTATGQPLKEILREPNNVIIPFSSFAEHSSDHFQTSQIRTIRNLSINRESYYFDAMVSENRSSVNFECLKAAVIKYITKILSFLKILFGINFLFGELPQANIQKCLQNSQLIIWASQGISELVVASLIEDKYGIVQKDLPVIITSLVQLKQALDKFNQVPSLSRHIVLNEASYRMMKSVTAAVKRSLMNICLHFGEYLNDLPLSNDVLHYLQFYYLKKF